MLDEQIEMLIAQREALERGEVPEVDHRELIDKIAALAQLIERIPADVARYGEQMHANTAALLRQSLTEDPTEFAETLARMFDGHDVIAESPEGQAFRAFTNLVGMPSQRAQLETDISEILTRVRRLPPHLAEILDSFIDMMWQRVQEVEGVRKGAFRRMNNFVRGGDALHYRSMRTRVTEAQASAAEAFRVAHGSRDIGFAVPLAGIVTMSVGRLRLDEGTAGLPDPVTNSSEEFIIDPAALAGQESIDWAALRAAVHEALEAHGGFATLPEVLAQLREPRAGDVIGIWALATRHGEVDETSRETVRARTSRGLRELTVPYLVFGDQLPDPIAAAHRCRPSPPAAGQPARPHRSRHGRAASMRDSTPPSFEDVFGDGLFPAMEPASPQLSPADMEEAFARDGMQAGGHLGIQAHPPRFDGDSSRLPPEACWALQELVAAPHVREGSSKHWSALLHHEDVLRSRLCELGLVLEINREYGYAFTRQADDPSPYSRTLLRARTLSLAASALALYLYNQYLISPDDPVVETTDMIDHMLGYKPPGNTDEAGFKRKVLAAIKSLEEACIIKPVTGTRRYVIYGVITSILSAERIAALDARYKALAAAGVDGSPPGGAGPDAESGTGAISALVPGAENGVNDG
jgi:hypothetical protein